MKGIMYKLQQDQMCTLTRNSTAAPTLETPKPLSICIQTKQNSCPCLSAFKSSKTNVLMYQPENKYNCTQKRKFRA